MVVNIAKGQSGGYCRRSKCRSLLKVRVDINMINVIVNWRSLLKVKVEVIIEGKKVEVIAKRQSRGNC